jgi:hypothetical protein
MNLKNQLAKFFVRCKVIFLLVFFQGIIFSVNCISVLLLLHPLRQGIK